MLGLRGLKALILAFREPETYVLIWKTAVALAIACAIMVGVTIYMPPPDAAISYAIHICDEGEDGACTPRPTPIQGHEGEWVDAMAAAPTGRIYRISLTIADTLRKPTGARVTCTVGKAAPANLARNGKPALCPPMTEQQTEQEASAPVHMLSLAFLGTNHYRFRLSCRFTDGEEVAVGDDALCKSSSRKPLAAIKIEKRRNYFSIAEDGFCKFAGTTCAPDF